eukprot:TRINITY_DN13996_c0_g1_i1.p1 TRINITY_DN13996_c0_g1~~TRINITY_DN13996_c0_g1_i1.p1  ORF type:complete len:585 (-),score=108.32 TRINITY_DN13996_c0_g1_i1:82-1836(-)
MTTSGLPITKSSVALLLLLLVIKLPLTHSQQLMGDINNVTIVTTPADNRTAVDSTPLPSTTATAILPPSPTNATAAATAHDTTIASCAKSMFACMEMIQNFGLFFSVVVGITALMFIFNWFYAKLHSVADKVDRQILENASEELTVLGLVSCVLFVIYAFTPDAPSSNLQFQNFVAFVHMVIISTIIMYVIFVVYLTWQRKGVVREWDEFEQFIESRSMDGGATAQSEEAANAVFLSFSKLKQKRFEHYEGVRRHFLHFHSLPGSFAFHRYLADCYDFLVLKFTRVKWRIGLIIGAWMLLCLVVNAFMKPSSQQKSESEANLYLFLTAAVINWILCALCIVTYILVQRFINQLLEESVLSGEDLRLIHCESLRMMQTKGIVEDFEDDNDLEEQEMKYTQTMQGSKTSKVDSRHISTADTASAGTEETAKGHAVLNSDLASSLGSEEKKIEENTFATMTLLNDRIPKEVRKRRRTRLQYWCPMIFEDDPYRRRFPFATPNFVLRLTQFTLLFQALFACLFFLLYIPILDWQVPTDIVICVLWSLPIAIFGIMFAPHSLRWLAMMRYSGPIAKIHFMARYLEAGFD